MENAIKITGVSLREFVKAVYDLSRPQGLGYLHFESGSLSNEEADAIVNLRPPESSVPLSMDYVRGRACKMSVFRDGGDLFIRGDWFDHTPSQLAALLQRIGVTMESA